MSDYYVVESQSLSDVADAIREKTGGTADLEFPDEFVSEIGSISGGGEPEVKEVTFFDYDGTVLYSYTPEEFLDLTEMPVIVSDTEMVSQGWNWPLAEAKSFVREYGALVIGQTRVPADGSTRIIVNVDVNDVISFQMGGTYSGTINWGDGTVEALIQNITHTFLSAGEYQIRIFGQSGNNYYINITKGNQYVKEVNFGLYATRDIQTNNWQRMPLLEKVSFPVGLKRKNISALSPCPRLKALIFPSGFEVFETGSDNNGLEIISFPYDAKELAFNSMPKLKMATFYATTKYAVGYLKEMMFCKIFVIGDGIVSVTAQRFCNLRSVQKLVFPSGFDAITGGSTFTNLNTLETLYLPDSITTIPASFTGIEKLKTLKLPAGLQTITGGAFTDAFSLSSLVIPSQVTSIANWCFSNSYSMREIHLLPTTPPTLGGTNGFTNIPADCIFYVPQGSLSAYQSATNWSTYASKMQEEPT